MKRKPDKGEMISALVAGALIAVAVFALGMSRENGVLRSVCDGFFVSGGLLLGVGALKWVRNRGAFDTVSYSVSSTFRTHLPGAAGKERETIYDYRERKEKARKPSLPVIIAGAVYMLLSVIALAVYHIAE